MSDTDEQQSFSSQFSQAPFGPTRTPFQPITGSDRLFGPSSATSGRPPQQSGSTSAVPRLPSSTIPHTQSVAGPAVPITTGQPAPAATAAGAVGSASGPAGNPVRRQGGSGPACTQPGAGSATRDAAIAANCAKTLSTFRSGGLSRSDAIAEISGHVLQGSGRAQDIAPYIEAICQHVCQTVIARAAGATRAAAASANSAPAIQPAVPAPAASRAHDPVSAATDVAAAPLIPGRRARSASPVSSQQPSDDDEENAVEHHQSASHRKRPHYDPSLAPFRAPDARSFAKPVTPHVARTLAIRANYCADLRAAKQDLLRDGRAPPFPEDLWEHILADRAVDFDRILSARFAPQVAERDSQQLGDLDAYLVVGTARATRKVLKRSQWEECWTCYADAVTYAYPHRDRELQSYHRFVNDLFDSFHDSKHAHVIKADVTMRNELALNRTWSFFDDDQLTRVHMRHTHVWGSAVVSAGASDDSKPARSNKLKFSRPDSSGEVCNNFNDRGCKYATCRHLHICRICYRRDHAAKDHLDAVRKEAEAGTRARIAARAAGGGGSPQ